MHPELIKLPIIGLSIKTYGFFLMVGFLSAVWLAMRRAQRVKADPDVVLDMSFLALLFGVGGARLFYVIHYWRLQFADAPNPLLAILDITEGGLEFLGGVLGALAAIVIYALRKKISLRLYLDVLAPGVMWGLAFGRLGCFFNGCCFGGLCVAAAAGQPGLPWAVRFPYASPAHWRQWEDRQVTVPAELITTLKQGIEPALIPSTLLAMSVEERERPVRRFEELQREYEEAKAEAPDSDETARLKAAVDRASKQSLAHLRKLGPLLFAQKFPSRIQPSRPISVTELEQLAAQCTSLPVHPTQLYSSLNALLLSAVLSALFYVRKRHGVVIGAMFVLYPIPRIVLEMIRTDNPHDIAGLTISQFVGIGMLVLGTLYLILLYKRMPERSPVLVYAPANE